MKCQVHKYKRVRLDRNKNPVYKCIRCPHYVIEPLVIGRECECWYCGNPFTMNQHSLLLKPHCGCKKNSLEVDIEKISGGAAIDKGKIFEKRAKKTPSIDSETKSELLDHLLGKLSGGNQ